MARWKLLDHFGIRRLVWQPSSSRGTIISAYLEVLNDHWDKDTACRRLNGVKRLAAFLAEMNVFANDNAKALQFMWQH
jgi:hypothetical protein